MNGDENNYMNSPSFTKYAYFAIDNIYIIPFKPSTVSPPKYKTYEMPEPIRVTWNAIKTPIVDSVKVEQIKVVSIKEPGQVFITS